MIGVGLGLGMVRGGGGGFNPLDSRLSWAPPPQSNPTIIQLPQGFFKGANPSGTAWVNISGNGRANGPRVLDDDEDFILLPYNGIRSNNSDVEIEGGRHGRLIGGHFRGRLSVKSITGSLYIEGTRFDLTSAPNKDYLNAFGKPGYQPNIYLQNMHFTGGQGTNAGTHADIFQPQGPIGTLYADKITGDCNYQGFFIRPEYAIRGADLRRMNLKFNALGTPEGNTFAFWFRNTVADGAPPAGTDAKFPVSLTECYARANTSTPGQVAAFPRPGDQTYGDPTAALGAINTAGTYTWPDGSGISGAVKYDDGSVADFVNSANVGVGYVGATTWQTAAPAPAPIYVSASGNDTTGTGLVGAPYATLAKALSVVATGGKIRLASDITLPNTVSYTGLIISTAGLTIESDTPGTRRMLDMSAMMSNTTDGGDGIRFAGDDQTSRDLRFTGYKPQFGGTPAGYVAAVNWRGARGLIENCEVDNSSGRGLVIGEGGTPTDTRVLGGAYHHNHDPQSGYGNADGIQVITAATGILIDGPDLSDNSDDGIDLFKASAVVTVRNVKARRNGFREDGVTLGGDGVGIKVGGSDFPNVAHVVEDCLTENNAGSAVSTNDNNGAIAFRRITSINNGRAGNGYPASFIADGGSLATFEDCVKYGGYANVFGGSVTQSYCSWTTPPGIGAETSAWFGINGLTAGHAAFGRPSIGSVLLSSGHTGGYIGWTGTATEAAPEAPPASAAFTSVGAGTVATATSGNLTLTEPAGCQAGDILTCSIAYRGSAPFTAPTGDEWSIQQQQSSGNTDVDLATNVASVLIATCVRGASAPNLVFTRTGGDVARGAIVAHRPAAGTIAVVGSSSNTLASAATAGSTGSITTDVDGCLLVSVLAVADNVGAAVGGFTATDPSGASSTTELTGDDTAGTWKLRRGATTTNGADVSLYICSAIKGATGATGTISTGSTGVNAQHAMAVVAYKAV